MLLPALLLIAAVVHFVVPVGAAPGGLAAEGEAAVPEEEHVTARVEGVDVVHHVLEPVPALQGVQARRR